MDKSNERGILPPEPEQDLWRRTTYRAVSDLFLKRHLSLQLEAASWLAGTNVDHIDDAEEVHRYFCVRNVPLDNAGHVPETAQFAQRACRRRRGASNPVTAG
jgi:hypothetical protein